MYSIDKEKFGSFVSQLRREQGLTQKELGDRLFVSHKAVSKWETGVSIPDTNLLIPLAELLGVSVTELLLCRRLPPEDIPQAEEAVQTAISCQQSHRGPDRRKWAPIFFLSLLSCFAACWLDGFRNDTPLLFPLLFGGMFGAYFIFFVPSRLPDYYDQNSISAFSDGPIRMNIPGIRFTNANWPPIVRALRRWSCATAGLLPWLLLLCQRFPWWQSWGSVLSALVTTLPLFFAICGAARKHR